MNVGITSFGGDGGKSGISQYIIQLLRQFAALGSSDQFELYLFASERSLFPNGGGVVPLEFDDRLRPPLVNVAWHQLALGRWCRRRSHDVLFLPAGNRRLPFRAPCPTVGTVHDFSSLHVRGKYDWARNGYIRHVLPRLMRRLTKVITISQCSKRDIVEYAGVDERRVEVIPQAVDHQAFAPADPQEARSRVGRLLGVEGPFVLYISRLEHPGKNHVRLIRAFDRLKRRHDLPHRLLLVGADWSRSEAIHREAAAADCAQDICLPGFVSAAHLADLYNASDLMVFPSLFEGFGLPVLEAMACGTPTACSNVSSLPEVAGDAAELFDPSDEQQICDSMAGILLDDQRRRRLSELGRQRAAQFSWQRTAAETLRVLQETATC